ncbi:phospholipase A and acyltransferase 3-like [Ylistrum balloti]|uniref:phospholipase A and acyltransferase 3-like n=1 Tax=Ylistrum balloti TaxID=509963 RepID=UPI002905BE82|nr:phospholipase A and acyltransferase 3-like [Ylistrum balloti]
MENAHNLAVLRTLRPGDMVEFQRAWYYSHWGVYIGYDNIVHLSGDDGSGSWDASRSDSPLCICGKNIDKARVKIDKFFDVAKGCKAKRNNDKDRKCRPLDPHEIVRRAKEMVGKYGYNVLRNNCEHFASYLRYNIKWSEQVDSIAAKVVIGGTLFVFGALAKAFLSSWKQNKK